MGKGIKVLRICSWILLALAGCIYGNVAVDAMKYSNAQMITGIEGVRLRDFTPLQWLKSAYLLLPAALLLAALVLLCFRRRTLQITALGVVAAAGVYYCVIPPQKLMLSVYMQYRFFPNFFPFKYLPDEFKINLAPFVSDSIIKNCLFLYQFFYLAALVLLVITVVMSIGRQRRPTI